MSKINTVLSGSGGRESACSAGDLGSIAGLGRFPGEGNGNPLLYSCLENPTDTGGWRAAVHGVAESDITKHLSVPVLKEATARVDGRRESQAQVC